MRKKLFEEQIVHIKYCTGLTEVAQWLKKKNLPANSGDIGSITGSGRCPEEGNGNPVFFAGKSHGQRSLEGYSSWHRKRVRHGLSTK